jgi:hypothetical protein
LLLWLFSILPALMLLPSCPFPCPWFQVLRMHGGRGYFGVWQQAGSEVRHLRYITRMASWQGSPSHIAAQAMAELSEGHSGPWPPLSWKVS